MNAIVLLFPTWALAPQKSLKKTKKQRKEKQWESRKAERGDEGCLWG